MAKKDKKALSRHLKRAVFAKVVFSTTASEFEENVKPYCSVLTALLIRGKLFNHVNSSVICCIKPLCIGVWEQLSPGITGELLFI
jgi:hypothetical protein